MELPLVHKFKLHIKFFDCVLNMRKPFEVRQEPSFRGFRVGDELLLREYVPAGYFDELDKEEYTGRLCHRKITYVLRGGEYGVTEGYAVLGLARV